MSSIGSDGHDRLEPRLLKAAEDDDVEALQHIVELACENAQFTDAFLRIGLTRSCDRGHVAATRYLLSLGATPDAPNSTKPSPLLRAVERGEIAIVGLLLDYGASLETRDKRGWTALMMAAWGDQRGMVELLLVRGADVNAKDARGRNVLHNLAADKQCDSGYDVVELLLDRTDCMVDGVGGRDQVGRSPLHWACATGKPRLALLLLTRSRCPIADVDAVEQRNKTALHLAVAHGREEIVLLLLQHRAQVNAKSDGGWTPLHNACDKGSGAIVCLLLQAGAYINGQLLNGVTPLHLAAQAGHREVVEVLLERKDLKRRVRDNFGSTPFLRAAQFKRKDVVLLLAPFNNVDALTPDARGACEGFEATIVDFGNFRNENRVRKTSVFNLLYGRDAENPRKQAVTTVPADSAVTDFRWIHLPANNMAWVEALLTKSFIEDGSHDVEGFKGLEKSFNYQHRGQRIHSNFMRPLCQSGPRAQWSREEDSAAERSDQAQERVDHNQPSRRRQLYDNPERADSYYQDDSHNSQGKKSKGPTKRGKTGAPGTPKQFEKKKAQLARRDTNQSVLSICKDNSHSISCNVWAFMPYLHFESAEKRQKMQDAIQRAETLSFRQPGITRAPTRDEQLINAHLLSSTTSLHVRRTLDQFFYPNIDTRIRDQDQVVYRYQAAGNCRERSWRDPKIFMVDQLWMWILGTNLIVTSFPQRWEQPRNDPLNVLDGIIEDINSKTRDPVRSVYDLAITITSRCSGVFDRHRTGDEEYQFLDMFEASIGTATDRETVLFKEFNTASVQASDWLKNHRKPLARFTWHSAAWSDKDEPSGEERYTQPLFVDKLLDIGQETDVLAETKDIRDELNMISTVLQHQQHILVDFLEVVCEIYFGQQRSQYEVKKRFKEQQRTIDMHLKDINRMDKQAERIYASITDLLDLKQKHANAFEARFARDQAAGTTRQGKIIMVFTIVTIVFLPLSFITSFFSIDIVQFPPAHPGSDKVSISYVAKYTFGIGFAISIPLILLALAVDDIGVLFRLAVRQFRRRVFGARKGGSRTMDERKAQELDLDRILSVARTRRSIETEFGSVLPVSEMGGRKSFSVRQGIHEL